MHRNTTLVALLLAVGFVWGCGGGAEDPAYDISGQWRPDGDIVCEGNTDSLVLDSLEAGFDPDDLVYVVEQDDHDVTFTAYHDGEEISRNDGRIYGDIITYSYSSDDSYGTTTGTIEAADRIYLEDSWTNTADDSEVECSFDLVPVDD